MTNKLFFNFIKIKKNTPFLWVILFIFSSFNPYFFLSPEDFLTKKTARAELNPTGSEYFVNIGPVAGTATANYVYASIFNPSGSTKTVLIKRVLIRAFASAAANYVNLTLRRISAASGGTQILASEIPKKNNYSPDPALETRYAGPTVTFAGTTNSRILSQSLPGAAGQWHSNRDIDFSTNSEPIVLQQGEGLALYNEAAGSTAHLVSIYIEWEEISSSNTPGAQNEYLFAFSRIENAGAANYVYHSFFNPFGSGRTAVIKRIWFGAETCDAAAVYTNNLVIRRISAASGGTQIPAADVPKKHTGSANTAMDLRHTGVTVTLVGGTDARIAMVTPCGAAGQPHGFMYLNFDQTDEKLILQPGEGIALVADAVGDIDQLIRLVVEWQEVTTTPSAQDEYLIALGRTEIAAAANTTFFTFFNPSGSGKTAIVKRLIIRNDADAAAVYSAFTWRRLSAASGGLLIAATNIPKKNTGSINSAMEIRWCGSACGTAITATYVNTTNSRILTVNGPGAVAQIIGHREIVFGDNEKLILQPGEGIGFYIEAVGDVDHYIKVMIEWQEATNTPSAQNEYLIDIGPVNGSTAANYVYNSFFNPSASGRYFVIKRVGIRIDAVGTGVYIPMTLRKINSASGGTQIAAANIPKKHSGSLNSVADIRMTGVTVSFVGTGNARLVSVQTPGAVAAAAAPSLGGYRELIFRNDEKLILKPGEGIALYQEAAGSSVLRVKILIEWQEVTSNVNSEGEYLFYTGAITGSLTSGYVYSSFFNPSLSGKNYLVKRMGIRVDRSAAATAPTYIPISIRKINSTSNGTLIGTTDILPKNSSTTNSTADVRVTNPTVNFIQNTHSRLLGVIQPGAINQNYGIYHAEIVFQDELMIAPGEGFALYQESATGDANFVVRIEVEWSEVDITYNQSAYRFFSNLDSTNVGSPLANQDTPATLSSAGQSFRLRILLHVATGTLPVSSQDFKLQFGASAGSNCSTSPPSSWVDVSNTSLISFNDNLTPVDNTALTSNANDPTHNLDTIVNQTYEEANNFTNSQSAILMGQDGKWDFSLKDNGASPNTTYCFRVVKADGSLLDGYNVIPQITTFEGAPPTLTFSVSDNSIGFGTLTSSAVRFATGDSLGSMTETPAHSFSVSTNASEGYVVMIDGTTLIFGSHTITPIGGTAVNVTAGVGTEQYGIRLTFSSGTGGSVSPPYNGSSNFYALDIAAFPDQIASGLGDGTTDTYSVFYAANISSITEAGNYTSILTFIASAMF